MAKEMISYPNNLKHTIKKLGYTIGEVADEAHIPRRTMTSYVNGSTAIRRDKLAKIAEIIGCTVEEILYTPDEENKKLQPVEEEDIMYSSRRRFLKTSALAITSALVVKSPGQFRDVPDTVVTDLTSMLQHYRALQRNGFEIEASVKSHLDLAHQALEKTILDKKRHDLWSILAQSQILARLSISNEQNMARAITWNEAAIASARSAGDTFLMAAAIGHLSHLHLIWKPNLQKAGQFLNEARGLSKGHHALNGWFCILEASIAAREKNGQKCENALLRAMELAYKSSDQPTRYNDAFFTDFSVVSVEAFGANCLLKANEPGKALSQVSSMDITKLSINRHASAYYDLSCAHAYTGDLEGMQTFAFQSIDKAIATNRLYIIPRFISLSNEVLRKESKETHASAIAEYAIEVLQSIKV